MTERIDHASEARRLQGGARDIIRAANKSPGTLAPHMAAVIMLDDARLEAQLALVEQQRIANLIGVMANALPGVGAGQYTKAEYIRLHGKANPQILSALGLTAGQERENDE